MTRSPWAARVLHRVYAAVCANAAVTLVNLIAQIGGIGSESPLMHAFRFAERAARPKHSAAAPSTVPAFLFYPATYLLAARRGHISLLPIHVSSAPRLMSRRVPHLITGNSRSRIMCSMVDSESERVRA